MGKKMIKTILQRMGFEVKRHDPRPTLFLETYRKYAEFTMIPEETFALNLELCCHFKHLAGDFVECGVWRGGMSAAVAEWLGGERRVHLFDSFEGLPPAETIDGKEAMDWQSNITSSGYYDNCKAEETYSRKAMELAGHSNFQVHAGWFNETLPKFGDQPIAMLRLDGDWYDSIMVCLNELFPKVTEGGIVILDDYYTWDGCARAVHDYLSRSQTPSRIFQWRNQVAYLIKKS